MDARNRGRTFRKQSHLVGLSLITLASVTLHAPASAEPAIGQFELKTLDSDPWAFEFQSQNAWSWGQPSRKVQDDGAGRFIADHNAVTRQRHALELEMGFTTRVKMRVGIEFEKERLDEPSTLGEVNAFDTLMLTEVGAEIVGIFIPRHGDGLALGAVAELEQPLDRDEPTRLNLGPIFEFKAGRWFAAAVPFVVHDFGGHPDAGERVDDKWDFSYASELMYKLSNTWTLSLEGYGTVERLGGTGRRGQAAQTFGDADQHRVGPVLYYACRFGRPARPAEQGTLADDDEENNVSIGLGLLAGLNDHTPDQTLKLSIEVHF